MQVQVLSNHSGQQLDRTIGQLREAETAAAAWRNEHGRAWNDLEESRRTKPWWRHKLGLTTVAEQEASARTQLAWHGVLTADQNRQLIDTRARQLSAGMSGEQALADGLAVLDDSWTMLRGYRNRRGETDHLLVGPTGVWAIEVKRRRIRLHVIGEQWWYEKLTAQGRCTEVAAAVDAGGRTWGRQVTDVAADLATWLAHNGHSLPVRTAVMIMHEQARLGRCESPDVNVVGTRVVHLLWAIERSATVLTAPQRQEIVALIRRDHSFHSERRG
ncbi:nuclease-related domain-containing protein [Actinoplanes awajinensis]|nr:nuclease-related domain-containing protein [Actinoplanes awajinensis]